MPIIDWIILPLLITLGIWAGGAWRYSFVATISIGLIFGFLLFGLSWWILLGSVVIYLGEKPSVGWPKGYIVRGRPDTWKRGAKPEWWQPKWTVDRPYWALALRGAFFIIPTFIISMPLAMWLAVRLHRIVPVPIWRTSEGLQYLLAALPLIPNH